jgi:spore germination protein GerM
MRRCVALIALVASVACGTAEPVAIPTDQVPFPLSRSVAPQEGEPSVMQLRLAFVRKGRLVVVHRNVTSRLPRPETAVRWLLNGPNPTERGGGMTSEIPSATRVLAVSVVDGIATVNLSQDFQRAAPSQTFLLRLAQVVYTLAPSRDVVAVRFSVDGRLVSVPTDRGQTVERPVDTQDYRRFRPRARRS